MPKWFIGLGILCVSLLGVLFGGSYANAATGDFLITNELVVNRYTCGDTPIINWLDEVNSSSISQIQKDKLNNALNSPDGSVLVAQDVLAADYKIIRIQYLEVAIFNGIPTIEYDALSDKYNIDNYTYPDIIYIDQDVDCSIKVDYYSFSAQPTLSFGGTGSDYTSLYGYTGGYTLGSTVDEEKVPSNLPYAIREEEGYNAGTGLIPLSDYTVDDLDIEIIDVTSQSEKILYKIDECMFQLPNNSSGDNFSEYMYDCDNPTTIEHTFGDGYAGYNIIHRMHSTETDLWYESTQVLDVDGSTFSGTIGLIYEDIFAKCINDDAPYIHFKECYTAFGKIANSMSFGAIKPLEAFTYEATSDCRQLGTLGDWLGLTNKTICPQFSSEVRSVVTPFISFGLALGVLGAILVKSDKDYM